MHNKIDNKYIGNAIDELSNLLGVREEAPTKMILKPFQHGKIGESIEAIANYLGLPVAVNLSYVPSTYRQGNSENRFESSDLATKDSTGRGVEGITAQVSIPSFIPLYGASKLQNFTVNVKISDNCRKYPQTFVTIMAHELSHILLHSLRHKEKNNEFYADLTAMILGFSKVTWIGRKVVETRKKLFSIETLTTTYGYLKDEQFNFAYDKIIEIRKNSINLKKKLRKMLPAYREQLYSCRKELFRFEKYMEYLDENKNRAIRKEDTPKIILFHKPDYADEFTAIIRINEERLEATNAFCASPIHYTPMKLNSLYEEIRTSIHDLREQFDLLHKDVWILRKYVGTHHRNIVDRQFILQDKQDKIVGPESYLH